MTGACKPSKSHGPQSQLIDRRAPVAKPDNFSTQGRLLESFLENGGCAPNQSLRHSGTDEFQVHQ